MATVTYEPEKLQWKQFPWYLKVTIIVGLIDAVIFAISFMGGFIEGLMMF